jgi:cytochrome b561
MQWRDTPQGYGWLSIALHWIAAFVVLALWFLGNSTQTALGDAYGKSVATHTSIAVLAYVFLWVRIAWRFLSKHPAPLPKQKGFFFSLGKCVHYLLLLAMALMLVSGPLMAWATGGPIAVFSWSIPSPLEMNTKLWSFAHSIHETCGTIILVATLLHIAGVFKHVAFNRDGTFDRMMTPRNDSLRMTQKEQSEIGQWIS